MILLGACASIFLIDSAVEAYTGPRSLAECLLEWPPHLLLAVGLGVVASIVPVTGVVTSVRVRVMALIAMLGSVACLGFTLAILVLYAVATSNID